MVGVKLFYSFQEYIEAMGFFAPRHRNQRCKFNRQNVFYIVKNLWMFGPEVAFLAFEAETYYDYALSFYMTVVVLTMAVFCAVLIDKYGLIVTLIEKYERFVEHRKSFNTVLTFLELKFSKFQFMKIFGIYQALNTSQRHPPLMWKWMKPSKKHPNGPTSFWLSSLQLV